MAMPETRSSYPWIARPGDGATLPREFQGLRESDPAPAHESMRLELGLPVVYENLESGGRVDVRLVAIAKPDSTVRFSSLITFVGVEGQPQDLNRVLTERNVTQFVNSPDDGPIGVDQAVFACRDDLQRHVAETIEAVESFLGLSAN